MTAIQLPPMYFTEMFENAFEINGILHHEIEGVNWDYASSCIIFGNGLCVENLLMCNSWLEDDDEWNQYLEKANDLFRFSQWFEENEKHFGRHDWYKSSVQAIADELVIIEFAQRTRLVYAESMEVEDE